MSGKSKLICPLLSDVDYKPAGESDPKFVECQYENCGFWNYRNEDCGIACLGDIYDVLRNRGKF